ncbi:unnamed protein product [Dicrocoelium dendriticum]|nr:unnamed protein product [Dicrocoelium dendriticum]
MQMTAFFCSDLSVGVALMATLIDLSFRFSVSSPSALLVCTLSTVTFFALLLFLFCVTPKVRQIYRISTHSCLGYLSALLLSADVSTTTTELSTLPILSAILLLLSSFFWILDIFVSRSTADSVQRYHWMCTLFMWCGFSLGSFHHKTLWRPLLWNLVLFVHWIVLHQISVLCFLHFALVTSFSCAMMWPVGLTDSLQKFPVWIREQPHPIYYVTVGIPIILFYSTYTMRLHIHNRLAHSVDLTSRWWKLIRLPHTLRLSIFILVFLVYVTFICFCFAVFPLNWSGVKLMPFVALGMTAWSMLHLLSFISTYHLNRTITLCNCIHASDSAGNQDMLRTWAAHGIRHLAVLSKRVHFLSALSTFFLFLLLRDTLALFLLCFPFEICFCSVFVELAKSLGGTAIGCILITPTVPSK